MSDVVVRTNEMSTFWPLLLDYDRRECLQILRRLELEAYSKIVAVLRAQGPLTEEKKKLLCKLQRLLSISIDRHKAEVRRALNDEELATISEAVCGKEVDEEWILEGKRISPIFQRPSPETIFLSQANKASFEQLVRNSRLPRPAETALPENLMKLIKLSEKNEVKPAVDKLLKFIEIETCVYKPKYSGTSLQRFRASQSSVISTSEALRPLSQVHGSKVIRAAIPGSNVGATYSPNLYYSPMINIATDGVPVNDQTNRTSVLQQNALVPSSSVVQFPSSGNNVIVLQKGFACKTFTPTSSIRIGQNIPVNTQTAVSGTFSTNSVAFPGRQFRIIGLPNATSAVCTASTIETQVYAQESHSSIQNNSNATSVTLSNQLPQIPHVGTIVEVDLDSDTYNEQNNYTDRNTVSNISNKIIPKTTLSSSDLQKITPVHRPVVSTSNATPANNNSNNNNRSGVHDTSRFCTQTSNDVTQLNIASVNKVDRLPAYSSEDKGKQSTEATSTDSAHQCIELNSSWNHTRSNNPTDESYPANITTTTTTATTTTTPNVFNINPPSPKRSRFELSAASVESSH
uniref:ENT domain-containing protein n=1 Tax=Trichobilharzia regenti TaxID=157069 RepID=A0AA85K662_TRIRE|nr:unnamed protein product [Trichobilharzia regenti]